MTDEGIVMMATHNVRLVILSVVVAIIASIQHWSCLAGNGSQGVSALRCGWLVVRSLWGGIWSMHFIAMLAYNLPYL